MSRSATSFVTTPVLEWPISCLLLVLPACGSDLAAPPPPPSTGSLQVTVHTTGALPDPDGYSLILDDDAPAASGLGTNGALTLPGLADGFHSLRLTGLAPNCLLTGDNPRTVEITSAAPVEVGFELDCPALGTLRIVIETTGSDLDDNGYQLMVDDQPAQPVDANATVMLDVPAGSHTLRLLDVAGNCEVSEAVRTVSAESDAETPVDFEIACATLTEQSSLVVEVSTQVINWPGFAFTFGVVVDHQPKLPISPNATLDIPVDPGTHSVLLKIPASCGVGGFTGPHTNPITVDVPRGGSATARFSVLCIG